MQAGDKNIKFFHQRASHRCLKNNILGIYDKDGVWQETDGGIALATKNYFQELFTSASPSEMDTILSSVDRVVTSEMNQRLLQPYTANEVQKALF